MDDKAIDVVMVERDSVASREDMLICIISLEPHS